jgi:YD repeat-containing protein
VKVLRYAAVVFIGLISFHISPPAKAAINVTVCHITVGKVETSYICDVGWWDDVPSYTGGAGISAIGGPDLGPHGGGAVHTSVNTNPTTNGNNSRKPKNPCSGQSSAIDTASDPVLVSSGAKIKTVTDFALPGEMGLKFERYYNSRYACADGAPCNGKGFWTSNLDYYLKAVCNANNDPTQACTEPAVFFRPDGSMLDFNAQSSFYETTGASVSVGTATLTNNGGGTYTVQDENDHRLAFDSQGVLQSVKDNQGIGWTLVHTNSSTVVVTHTNGQSFTIHTLASSKTNGDPEEVQITDPAGNVYDYKSMALGAVLPYGGADDPLSHLDQLTSVTLPGSPSTVISYQYYPPTVDMFGGTYAQLKEVDYNGVAHDITTYDPSGRVTADSLADGSQKTTIAYGSNSTGATATVTNPLGHVNVYQYDSAYQYSGNPGSLLSIDGQAAQTCVANYTSMIYDANGFLSSSTDGNGNTTDYTYDAKGLLQKKVEAVGTSVQRTTDYNWETSAGAARLHSVTVEGWNKTVFTYSGDGRLASVAVTNLSSHGTANQTLTTTYARTLYSNGMVHVLTVTHPSPNGSNADVLTFDSVGRLTSSANGLGQTTNYSNYNALGEPGKVVGPNGDETDYTYDARGRVVTKVTHPNGTTATWSYGYDGFGLLSSETDPDGKITMWSRDAATMRVAVIGRTENDGDSTESFTYDANGDVISDVIQRGNDIGLSKTMIYDALGRLYKVEGQHGQVLTYTYDANDNVTSVTSAAGTAVSYQYDPLNRVIKVIKSSSAIFAPGTAPSLTVPSGINSTGTYPVSWSSISTADTYQVENNVNSGSWSAAATVDSSATGEYITGKSNGTYGYRVRACNIAGCGPWSSAASVTVLHPPPAPASISVPSTSSGSVAVSWPSSSTAASYILQHKLGSGSWSQIYNGSGTSKTVTETSSGTYTYRVKACNAGGCSSFKTSSAVTVTIPTITCPSNPKLIDQCL